MSTRIARYQRPLIARAPVIPLLVTRTNPKGTDSRRSFPAGARQIHLDADLAGSSALDEARRLSAARDLALGSLPI